jgi:putative ABC transport system permease protein
LPAFLLLAALAATTTVTPAPVLLSEQLLREQHLAVGDVVQLSADPTGRAPRAFRIAGVYAPVPDPKRLGEVRRAARLHLSDMNALPENGDPAAAESVSAINVALTDPGDAAAFARDLQARMPGIKVRTTTPTPQEAGVFVVLDRFHLAIALVTVVASSLFLLALMVMLVDERRDTVAVLRLIGLRRRRILLQVLAEGLFIAAVGALGGVVLAVLLEGAFNRFFQWRYETALVFVHVTPKVALRSVALAVPLGVAATLASSWGLLRGAALSLARR